MTAPSLRRLLTTAAVALAFFACDRVCEDEGYSLQCLDDHGRCADLKEPATAACAPDFIPEGKAFTIEVGETCGGCGTGAKGCEVTVDGDDVKLDLVIQSCELPEDVACAAVWPDRHRGLRHPAPDRDRPHAHPPGPRRPPRHGHGRLLDRRRLLQAPVPAGLKNRPRVSIRVRVARPPCRGERDAIHHH